MSGAFSSFAPPMNLAGMMQGMARQGVAAPGTMNGRLPGGGRGGGMPNMNLAPFGNSNFNANSMPPNANFLAFISPNNGGRGGGNLNTNRPGVLGNVAIPAPPPTSSSSAPTSTIPPTASREEVTEEGGTTKNGKRRKHTVMSADGSLLLLPRNDPPSPDTVNPFNGSAGNFASLPSGQSSGQPRRKHRVKTGASDVALSTKAQELAGFFEEHLPQHANVTNTATLAHWLKAIRESEHMQEASKVHDIDVGSVFEKCSTAADMLARATRREQAAVPSLSPDVSAAGSPSRGSVVFSQSYDDGVSLFDGDSADVKSELNADEDMLSQNSTPIKNNWLPDLLLLIAQLGYDKCFRDISQCVAMLLIDIDAPAPVPLKDKDSHKTNGANAR